MEGRRQNWHEIRRTVTETDNLLFSVMTHNPQPLHIDAEFAAKSEFGRILVNGTFTFSLMVGLSVADTTMGALIANLGYDKVVMPRPVYIGDTLHAVTEIVEVRARNRAPKRALLRSSMNSSINAVKSPAGACARR
jgi:acyl dehydratase